MCLVFVVSCETSTNFLLKKVILKQQKLIKKLLRRRGITSNDVLDGQQCYGVTSASIEVTTDTTSKPADYEALNDSSDSAIAGEVRLIVPSLPASTTTEGTVEVDTVPLPTRPRPPPPLTVTGGYPRSEIEAISSDQAQAPNNGRKIKDERQRISNRQKLLLLKRHHSGLSQSE